MTEKLENLSEVAQAQNEATTRIETRLENVIHTVADLPREFHSLDRIENELPQVRELVLQRETGTSMREDAQKVRDVANNLERQLTRLEQALTSRESVSQVLEDIESATRQLQSLSNPRDRTSQGSIQLDVPTLREVNGYLCLGENVTNETPQEVVEGVQRAGEIDVTALDVRIENESDGPRKELLKSEMEIGKGVSAFGKGVAKIGKKLSPILGPLFSLVGNLISLGACGVTWLAKNLWLLVLLFVYFVIQELRRKKESILFFLTS